MTVVKEISFVHKVSESAFIEDLTDKMNVYKCDLKQDAEFTTIKFIDIEYKIKNTFFNKHFKIKEQKHDS